MFETLRKMMMIGLGAAAISKDRIKQWTDDFVERGEISSEEGKKLYEEWVDKAEEQGKKLNESIRKQIRHMLKELGVADRAQIGHLEKKIEDLEAKIEAMSSKIPRPQDAEEIPTAE